MMARLKLFLDALRGRPRYERELDDELDFHRAMRVDALVAEGVARDEAERRARAELGMTELYRDDCRRARGLGLVDAIVADARYAGRTVVRSPGYAATAVLVLALPIAASLALFALFNAYALRSPPIAHPANWVAIDGVPRDGMPVQAFTAAEADDVRSDPPAAFAGIYSLRRVQLPVAVDRQPFGGMGQAVSANYFDLLGVGASPGRRFDARSAQRDRGSIVLSRHGWQRFFGGAADVVGRSMTIAGRTFEVLGVADAAFAGTQPWTTLYWMLEDDHRTLVPGDLARDVAVDLNGFLADGATAEQGAAALTARLRPDASLRDEELRVAAVRVQHRRGHLLPSERADVLIGGIPALAALALLLAVAAANLANLVLARFAARRHDLALRAALGASRMRLVSQLLAECALLALIAAQVAFGVVAGVLGPLHEALFGFNADFGVDLLDVGVDARVWAYGMALSLGAALVFGAVPAALVTSPFARGGRELDAAALRRANPSRLRGALMVVQIAASVLLVVVAGLVAANARRIETVAIGYDASRLVSFETERDGAAVARALAALPQVEAVGTMHRTPMLGEAPDLPARADGRDHALRVRFVDPGYYAALDLEPLQGRLPAATDAGRDVVAISRRTAELLWPGGDALGRTFELDLDFGSGKAPTRLEVVGVVEDVATGLLLGGVDRSAVYVPVAHGHPLARNLVVKLRDAGVPTLDALYDACIAAAPALDCRPFVLTRAVELNNVPFVMASRVAGVIGWSALAISCIGLYGLVGFLVVQQRREIGIRMALGATVASATRATMVRAARQVALGVGLGLAVAWGMSIALASVTETVQTFDTTAFVRDPVLLALVALLAAWLPARRCASIRPSEALRAE